MKLKYFERFINAFHFFDSSIHGFEKNFFCLTLRTDTPQYLQSSGLLRKQNPALFGDGAFISESIFLSCAYTEWSSENCFSYVVIQYHNIHLKSTAGMNIFIQRLQEITMCNFVVPIVVSNEIFIYVSFLQIHLNT